ncbi:uncharacterized protein [Maniola hyperantus]|uniref:uncharacterized protein n=1 Tax=Aphantopus hyperantus TaxID=2795564 RepID=UPI003747E172
MPKRKNNELEYISKKIRKLEEKLRRARRMEESSDSSSSSELLDLQNDAGDEFSICSRPPSPIEEVEIISMDNEPLLADVPPAPPEIPAESTEVPNGDQALPDEILEILGEDPSSVSQLGPEIRKELANRLNHIAISGLDKDVRKELFQNKKYMVPTNSERIAAPLLNLEIRAALPDTILKRDKGMETRQKQISAVISCIARVIDNQIKDNNADSKVTKELMDSIRMLCDIQYSDSMRRRYFILSCVKRDVLEHLKLTKVDKYLFGENISETLKTAKTVSKSRAEIIKIQDSNNKGTIKRKTQPSTSTLNYRAPPARRQPVQKRSHPPAPARKPEFSSRGSRHHQQQYRNPRRD